ncbi:MAG: hypothetical protein KHW62_02005 [Clostridiales bacterium]|nr:hypothetical protein [Clostridiales bacterium]
MPRICGFACLRLRESKADSVMTSRYYYPIADNNISSENVGGVVGLYFRSSRGTFKNKRVELV